MGKNKYLLLLLILIFTVTQLTKAQTVPTDFTFNYTFGFGLKKTYDHRTNYDEKKNILTVYGVDTVMKFSLKLTLAEKQNIYEKLYEINFTSYPNKYSYQYHDTVEAFIEKPCQQFSLTVTADSKTKSVDWNNCVYASTKDLRYEALKELDRIIQKRIWAYNPLKDYHPTKMNFDPE